MVKNKKPYVISLLLLLIFSLFSKPSQAAWVKRGPFPYPANINTMVEHNGIWAGCVGGYLAYWDGSAWSGLGAWPAGTSFDIYAMTVGGDGLVWAGGEGGHVARHNGYSWEDMGLWIHGTFYIYALTTSSSGAIWAGGVSGHTARWNGTWEDMGTPFSNNIRAIAEAPDGSIWVGGISGYVARWKGGTWEYIGQWPHGGYSIYAITVSSDGTIWFGGSTGYVARWNGSAWDNTGLCLGRKAIYSLTATPDGTIWAAGEYGNVARYKNNTWEELGKALDFTNIYSILSASDGSIWVGGSVSGSGRAAQWIELIEPSLSIVKDGNNAVLTWTISNNATSYVLERSIDGNNFTQLIETTQNTYTDQGLSPGSYYYRVKAKLDTIISGYSNVVSITIEPPPEPPILSVNLDGENANLSWTSVLGANSYQVERSTDGSNFVSIYQTSGNSYTDQALLPGTYYYRISTIVNSNLLISNTVSVNIEPPPPPPPPPPPKLWVYWPEGDRYVKVEWQREDADLSGDMVQLWREDTISGIWVPVKSIAEIEKDAFEWVDTNVTASMNYKYQVRVYDPATWEWRIAAESDWAALDRPFPAPGGLRVASSTDTTATVTWTPVSGATTYQVQTSTDGGLTWHDSTAGGPPVTVPRPSMVRVKAGTHARSQWSGILRVN